MAAAAQPALSTPPVTFQLRCQSNGSYECADCGITLVVLARGIMRASLWLRLSHPGHTCAQRGDWAVAGNWYTDVVMAAVKQ